MLAKPDACKGCPLYGDGMGFVPDETRDGVRVALLAQNPGKDEETGQAIIGYAERNPLYERTTPRPLIGSSGWLLFKTYTPLAGLQREDISLHNVLKCRYQHTNTLPKGDIYDQAVEHCTQAHLRIPQSVEIIVAHGAAAWEYVQGKGKPISEWRGFLGSEFNGRRVYATLHTADLLRDPHARFIARFDWKRLRTLLDGQWPLPVPRSILASPANRAAFIQILEEAHEQPEIMVDTEYIPDKQLLTHIGAAWRVGETVHGFQVEWLRGRATSVERSLFMRHWARLCQDVTMGFWNAKADLPIIEANLHHIPLKFEDPMQAHACLWPDMDHDYGFVASIYGRYNKLKHLSKDDILLYHWGDCIDLVWIWEALKDEFTKDPQVEKKYRQQNLPLIPILLETEAHGIRINRERVDQAIPEYQSKAQSAQDTAQAYCGYPLNLGSSSQLCTYFQAGEGLHIKSVDQNVVAVARAKYLPVDSDYEEKEGFSLEYVCERLAQGAHPLLELRAMYAQNHYIVGHYLEPLRGVERCYPNINIHTQAAGRHSTTDPPLATVPNDLRDLVVPDCGDVWVGGDLDAQEPRIQASESGSQILSRAFTEGEDIHTTFVCQLYGWTLPTDRRDPHTSSVDSEWRRSHAWGGKDDPRRVFAKTTRYEINYGGDGTQAAKKAIRMGLEPAIAKRAAQVLLASDPELAAWFRKVEKDVVSTRISRSWGGGRRVYYWLENTGEMGRKARNFPMQGGGADLYNLILVEVAEKLKDLKFVYGMHDSFWWRCQLGLWVRNIAPLKYIITQPRLINNTPTVFPITMKVMFPDGRVEKVREA